METINELRCISKLEVQSVFVFHIFHFRMRWKKGNTITQTNMDESYRSKIKQKELVTRVHVVWPQLYSLQEQAKNYRISTTLGDTLSEWPMRQPPEVLEMCYILIRMCVCMCEIYIDLYFM